jgi:hypothetical protein
MRLRRWVPAAFTRRSGSSAFEKQKAAEIEAAKERDRQAYRERGWPSR